MGPHSLGETFSIDSLYVFHVYERSGDERAISVVRCGVQAFLVLVSARMSSENNVESLVGTERSAFFNGKLLRSGGSIHYMMPMDPQIIQAALFLSSETHLTNGDKVTQSLIHMSLKNDCSKLEKVEHDHNVAACHTVPPKFNEKREANLVCLERFQKDFLLGSISLPLNLIEKRLYSALEKLENCSNFSHKEEEGKQFVAEFTVDTASNSGRWINWKPICLLLDAVEPLFTARVFRDICKLFNLENFEQSRPNDSIACASSEFELKETNSSLDFETVFPGKHGENHKARKLETLPPRKKQMSIKQFF